MTKKIIEWLAEKGLLVCGLITSITIVLIVIFLFKEGATLFKRSSIENGYVLLVNKRNPLDKLNPLQVKDIFDGNVTNWSEVNGLDEDILLFRVEDIYSYYSDEELGEEYEFLPERINDVIDENEGIIAFIPQEYVLANSDGKLIKMKNITPKDFFFGKIWLPTATPAPQFGVLPLILGTLWVSFFAILIALPLGLAVAIYLAEIASHRLRNILKPIIELLAGIPSVVYGFFGLVVVAPLIQKIFNLPLGETGFTGSLILAVMALPTIISVAEDALRTTPRSMKEASLALGANRWQTIYKVVIPYAISGISAAAVLGIGRAIGETMAVLMVTGNAAVMPDSIMEPLRTIPATIAAELGEAPKDGAHYQALFMLGCILFLINLIISISVEIINSKRYER